VTDETICQAWGGSGTLGVLIPGGWGTISAAIRRLPVECGYEVTLSSLREHVSRE